MLETTTRVSVCLCVQAEKKDAPFVDMMSAVKKNQAVSLNLIKCRTCVACNMYGYSVKCCQGPKNSTTEGWHNFEMRD